MKTKIIGLAAITLALVMSVGMVSADHVVTTTIGVEGGYAIQEINYDLQEVFGMPIGTIDNWVAIGNFGVTADCVPPWEKPDNVWEALIEGVVYNPDVKGTGTMTTSLGLVTQPDYQKSTKFFKQEGYGHKVGVLEEGNVWFNTQDLLFATDGDLDFYEETKQVSVRTCTNEVTQVILNQQVSMSSTDPAIEKAMLFHELDAPTLNNLYIDQYLAAPDIDWGLNLLYDIPT